ncbi:uncharacterized protein LOC111809328 [Cucurbita pepo subsp. pepo]|uniref:uncharacterized protein LOC111809328 n=1 Tax=Cucurbita pepo subsp. pepo TaxID=3664 RepID=UPI000C9D3A54|nr:uncharacterized protein LOC111809328 [Cucurbita pepo subsp. pepo]
MFTPQKAWSGVDSASNPNSVTPNLSRRGDGIKGSAEAAALDQEGLAEKIYRLENELFEYQYNMGLLLIEKRDWTYKYDELKQALAEANDTLKREQMAHVIAISDAEKQEENLKIAMGVEKECVLDLEKALHEMRAENAELKFTGDSKLAEANALVTSIEEKSLEVVAKLRAADAKLAEVSGKNSEVERKLQDLEAREGALRRDRLSFNAEQEAHEATLSKQRDDLREWERKQQDAEERLAKGQTILNQREERANGNDGMVKQKERDLEEARKKIESANLALKRKEEDISSRLANIALKEQESDALKVTLEIKEKELLVLEEKISAREKVEIQKLLDEHNVILDAKKVEFELEIDRKRKSFDEELKNKVSEVEKKEAEIKHMEEKVGKQEQALEKRTEKFKEKEADYDTKLKALKERVKATKSEAEKLEVEKKQLLTDKEDLISLKAEMEKIRFENDARLSKLHEERESLKVSETERSDFLVLQSELKQEVEKYRQQKELLLKKEEDLKQQKENFEREWEELDEKRALAEQERKTLLQQKEEFEKRIFSEEERLKNERSETEAYIDREQEDLKLARESFVASMEHEKSAVAEKARSEKSRMMHDFELRKRELESAMQNRVEEMEREFREKEKRFIEEKERELENIKFLRDVARRGMDELKLERLKTEKEKQETIANKEHLGRQRIEIRKDIEELLELSNKLKDQRERLIVERDRFLSYVDKRKTCKNCGETASAFMLSDFRYLDSIENADVLNLPGLPGLPDRYMEIQGLQAFPGGALGISDVRNGELTPGVAGPKSRVSGGTISWLRKCTSKIFKFSPGKKIASPAEKQDDEAPKKDEHDEAELSIAIASDSLDYKRVQSDVSGREVEPSRNSTDDQSNIVTKAPEVAVDSQPSDVRVANQRKLRPRREKPKVGRTRSVKAVVEDAKAIVGGRQQIQQVEYPNGYAEDSSQLNESRDESSLASKGTQGNSRKRTRANSSQIMDENDHDDSEVRSGSVVEVQPRKRRQKAAPAVRAPEKRYNLRRTKAASKDPSTVNKEKEEDAPVNRTAEDVHHSKVRPTPSMGVTSNSAGSTHLVRHERVGDGQDDVIAGTSKNSTDMVSLSEEVKAGKDVNPGQYKSESCEEVGDEDEEESNHPGEVSIAKKLWMFTTTWFLCPPSVEFWVSHAYEVEFTIPGIGFSSEVGAVESFVMFTPQKAWSGWPLTPKTGAQKGGAGSASNPNSVTPNLSRRGDGIKGKTVAFGETATPLSGTVVENGRDMFVGSAEAAALDQEGFAEKISRLENELFEYQYNMGLLLIEKKDWALKYEELKQALAEANDTIKREQMAHMIAISDAEKQEESLKKALGVEKECVLDLEKALREMRAENAEIKFIGDSKLSEANALVTSIEEKSLEVEAKLRAADAKLAEVSRKNSEVERKLQDLEAREGALRRDRLSFNAEREALEATLSKQRDDLREWERKQQDAEERLAKGQTILNQREERANENDRMVKQKERDLEETQKKIESANLALKRKEEDISSRLANIALKEQESDALKVTLEIKEKELLVLEEKLSAREKVEIQKLLDEHNAILDAKKVEFELEIDQKRKSLDEELKNKVSEVEKKEAEIKHMEEKVAKREQALEKRTEKFKEKEADYDTKLKALKEREKSMKTEEKKLEAEKKQLLTDKEDLISLMAEVEKIRAENEAQLLKLHEEKESLKVSETEKSDFLRLQSELKQEIEKYREQKELLLKEAEDLKQQKETFEREWEELDEKRAQVEKEQKTLLQQKEEFEKRIFSEEERLRNERAETEAYILREQEDLKLAQESFAASMEHEKSAIAEKAQSDRSQMLHDFELQKRELESSMQNRVEEMEREFREKEKLFKEEKERELENIKFLRDVARRDMEELKLERLKTDKEKQEAEANKEHLEKQRIEIRKDIEELLELSNKLKNQRERLVEERDRFISYVDKLMTCKNCGETASEFVLSDLQSLGGIENADVLNLPGLPDRYMEIQGLHVSPGGTLGISDVRNGELTPGAAGPTPHTSSGTISWLRKCTSKIFKFSPSKKIASPAFEKQDDDEAPISDEHDVPAEPSKRVSASEEEAELSLAIASDSLDDKRVQSDVSGREVEPSLNLSTDDQSNVNSKAPEVAVDSQPSATRVVNQRKLRPRREKPKISRTRSVKAVVEESKAIIGELQQTVEYPNGNAEDSSQLNNESRDESSLAGKGTRRNLRKRTHANSSQIMGENDNDDSEVRSGSVVEGQPRKRRQRAVPAVRAPEKRYNLRRTKAVGASKDPSNISKGNEEDAPVNRTEEDVHYSKARPTPSMGVASDNAGSTYLVRCGTVGDNQDVTIAGTSKNSTDMVSLSEEVNGSPEIAGKYGDRGKYKSESCDEDDDDDEEESEHPGEASIGKKLWTFFTT